MDKNSEVPLIVFLRTSEEATCTYVRAEEAPNVITPNCNYVFVEPSATVTGVETGYDETQDAHLVTLTGSGFDGPASATELIIDGIVAECISLLPNQAIFKITNLKYTVPQDVQLYFEEGVPNGLEVVQTGLSFEPAFISLTPNTGSAGGTRVKISVTGLGTEDEI